MVKIAVTLLLIFFPFSTFASNAYERNCVECHKKLPVGLDKFFFNYLLKYSSEKRVKKALKKYLKNPNIKDSLATEEIIKTYGLMPKSNLSDKELIEAIDIYWETYKVFGRLE